MIHTSGLRQIFVAETGGSAPVRRAERKLVAETAGRRTGELFRFGAPKQRRTCRRMGSARRSTAVLPKQRTDSPRGTRCVSRVQCIFRYIPVKPKLDALDDWRVSALACDSESDPGTHRVMSIIAARVGMVCKSHCSVPPASVPVLLGVVAIANSKGQ